MFDRLVVIDHEIKEPPCVLHELSHNKDFYICLWLQDYHYQPIQLVHQGEDLQLCVTRESILAFMGDCYPKHVLISSSFEKEKRKKVSQERFELQCVRGLARDGKERGDDPWRGLDARCFTSRTRNLSLSSGPEGGRAVDRPAWVSIKVPW